MYGKIPKHLKVVVFDLDETLHHTSRRRMPIKILDILKYLHDNSVSIALASLNQNAPSILYYYGILHWFAAVEYRTNIFDCLTNDELDEHLSLKKTNMINRLMNHFNVHSDEILFFDDSILHILDAKQMNIKAICVDPKKLLTWTDLTNGFSLFDKRKRRYSYG